ncbi:two pore domain potassium channel family protein [Enterobacter cloacae complex sp. P14RS]|uniref:potassium channel family protein n=1 Tax=Enterobacter TaxID=547 RepID=UPI0018683332|nr:MULTISPECIES: potassium channel family protein [Enterobacter]MBE3482662.1 two pore domain potassium channel family protein [Enterobacter cloacae complex sp. P14RS]
MFLSWVVNVCRQHLFRLTWTALLCLFAGHYLLCFIVFHWLGETTLVGRISDFVYYSSVVGATIGFGDLSPQSEAGELFTAFWQIPIGVGLFGALMGKIIALVQGLLAKGIAGMGNFSSLHNHVLVIGWRGHQTEKMISLLLYDEQRVFSRVVLCEQQDIAHPLSDNLYVDFLKVSNYSDPKEQKRMGLVNCSCVVIFSSTDEQTFTATLSLVNDAPAHCHIVAYLEDERYAGLLETHCPTIEIVRNLSAEQLSRSIQDPGSSQSVASIMNPMLGDTGYTLMVPTSVSCIPYGALMHYMKLQHDATVLGISHCKNGRGMELNPEISTEVRGGMWLHLIGNSRISSNEVCWQNIGKSHAELIF